MGSVKDQNKKHLCRLIPHSSPSHVDSVFFAFFFAYDFQMIFKAFWKNLLKKRGKWTWPRRHAPSYVD